MTPFTLTPGKRVALWCWHEAVGFYEVPMVLLGKGACLLPDGSEVSFPGNASVYVPTPHDWAQALWNMPRIRAALGGAK